MDFRIGHRSIIEKKEESPFLAVVLLELLELGNVEKIRFTIGVVSVGPICSSNDSF